MDLFTATGAAETPDRIFLIAHMLVLIVGVALAFFRRDTHPIRRQGVKSIGYGLIALGAAGTLIGFLRLGRYDVPDLYVLLLTILDVMLIGASLYFVRSVLPGQMAGFDNTLRGRTRPSPVSAAASNRPRTQQAAARAAAQPARPAAPQMPRPTPVARPTEAAPVADATLAPSAAAASQRRSTRRDRKRKK